MATSTPARLASAICRATPETTSASRPIEPPPNTSPESLSRTRRGRPVSAVVVIESPGSWCAGGPDPRTGRGHRHEASGADAEPGEAGQRAAGLLDDLADGRLGVTRVGLVQQHGLLEETVHPALDDLRQGGLGLALVARGLLGDPTLALHDVGRHVLTGAVLGAEIGRASCRERVGLTG